MEHHVVKLIKDLMYKGCEPHWQCIKCDECVPAHCYSKEEFEQQECRTVNSKPSTSVSQRKQITKHLSELLERHLNPHNDTRIYISKEVTFNYGSSNNIRVDYMMFKPQNNTAGGIEQGLFYCYEIKSCKADFESGNGLNFIGDYNYIVFPSEEVYLECKNKVPYGVGVYVSESNTLKNIKKSRKAIRKYSASEMLLMMFRSANREMMKNKNLNKREM